MQSIHTHKFVQLVIGSVYMISFVLSKGDIATSLHCEVGASLT